MKKERLMKKILSFIIIATLLLCLPACKKTDTPPDPEWMLDPQDENIINFKKEIPEMSVGEAKTYLESSDADPTTAQYRRAVYAVNEAVVTDAVKASFSIGKQTDEVKKLFEKIDFNFINGEALESAELKNRLSKRGLIEKEEDGTYKFTFHDRTLAQTASNVKSDHAIGAYTEVLELLLNDPNVIVDTLE